MDPDKLMDKLEKKFSSCMLGALIGDCFGAPFENGAASRDHIQDFLQKQLLSDERKEYFDYTDDTEMAKSVAQSLIDNRKFDGKDMVRRFVKEYYDEPPRCYGQSTHELMRIFKEEFHSDIFQPAAAQFGGQGSFGNGAAMRTHPVALFCYNLGDEDSYRVCSQTAKLTHCHPDGVNGAILQSLAVKKALNYDPEREFLIKGFLGYLISFMEELESTRSKSDISPSFSSQLQNISQLLNEDPCPEEVAEELGNEITATKSVPAAIYAFLRGLKPLSNFKSDDPLVRTLYFCLAMGGDTDTIASMACSISGAYYGKAPEVLYSKCKDWNLIENQGKKLAEIVVKSLKNLSS